MSARKQGPCATNLLSTAGEGPKGDRLWQGAQGGVLGWGTEEKTVEFEMAVKGTGR